MAKGSRFIGAASGMVLGAAALSGGGALAQESGETVNDLPRLYELAADFAAKASHCGVPPKVFMGQDPQDHPEALEYDYMTYDYLAGLPSVKEKAQGGEMEIVSLLQKAKDAGIVIAQVDGEDMGYDLYEDTPIAAFYPGDEDEPGTLYVYYMGATKDTLRLLNALAVMDFDTLDSAVAAYNGTFMGDGTIVSLAKDSTKLSFSDYSGRNREIRLINPHLCEGDTPESVEAAPLPAAQDMPRFYDLAGDFARRAQSCGMRNEYFDDPPPYHYDTFSFTSLLAGSNDVLKGEAGAIADMLQRAKDKGVHIADAGQFSISERMDGGQARPLAVLYDRDSRGGEDPVLYIYGPLLWGSAEIVMRWFDRHDFDFGGRTAIAYAEWSQGLLSFDIVDAGETEFETPIDKEKLSIADPGLCTPAP